MPQVHPTAIVEDQVELADDVVVGPWCHIEGPVRIGAGTKLMHRVSLRGPLTIGQNNIIYPNAMLGFEPQDRKFDPETQIAGAVIGDDNIIREGFTLHRATGDTPTTIGSRGYFMANSHIAHDCIVGDDVMMANGALLAGHVTLQDQVILGGNAVVHQNTRLGRMSMLAGIRGVNQDLPPFCISYVTKRVNMLNLVGLRRGGYRDDVNTLKQLFNIFFRKQLPVPAAIAEIEASDLIDNALVAEFVEFVKGAKRGVTPYGNAKDTMGGLD
jgi:UDP-N-acetylglucosamine acyltransferase